MTATLVFDPEVNAYRVVTGRKPRDDRGELLDEAEAKEPTKGKCYRCGVRNAVISMADSAPSCIVCHERWRRRDT